MVEDVEQLLDVGAWWNVLTFHELAYHELTLEVLATFDRHQGPDVWDDPNAINLKLHGHEYHLSYIEFALFMGLYDKEYTTTNEYLQLYSYPSFSEL